MWEKSGVKRRRCGKRSMQRGRDVGKDSVKRKRCWKR